MEKAKRRYLFSRYPRLAVTVASTETVLVGCGCCLGRTRIAWIAGLFGSAWVAWVASLLGCAWVAWVASLFSRARVACCIGWHVTNDW